MKRSTLAAIGGTTAALAGVTLAALAARRKKPERMLPLRSAELYYTEVVPGVSAAVLRGDPDRGAYARFTRFDPGVEVPWHTHPHDIRMVVLAGAYLYGTEEGEIPVTAGSYFEIPAGVPHTSRADPVEGCLFYEESEGKFGLKTEKAARGLPAATVTERVTMSEVSIAVEQ